MTEPGTRRHRAAAGARTSATAAFVPPKAGVYYIYVGSDAAGAPFNRNPHQIFRAVPARESERSGGGDGAATTVP